MMKVVGEELGERIVKRRGAGLLLLLHFDLHERISLPKLKRPAPLRWFVSGARTSPLIFQFDGPMQNLLPRLAIGNSQICFLCRDLRPANRNAKEH